MRFETFPAATHSDWHLWDLTYRRRAFDVANVPFKRIIGVVDDWNKNRDLMIVAEAQVGAGRLILCAADIVSDLERRPVARTFRAALSRHASNPSQNTPAVSVDVIRDWWARVSS